jgi:hypothetical protein
MVAGGGRALGAPPPIEDPRSKGEKTSRFEPASSIFLLPSSVAEARLRFRARLILQIRGINARYHRAFAAVRFAMPAVCAIN